MCSGKISDYYTRIIGYFTRVSAWNKGRRKEHGTRVFKENASVSTTFIDGKMQELAQSQKQLNQAQ